MTTCMCLAIREVIKNYSGYLATKIAIFAFEHDNRHYVAIAGDSRPFTNVETLNIGVTPNLSTANAGSQRGSGTKMASAMLGPNGEGHLIFISNTVEDGLQAISGRQNNGGNGWGIEAVDQKLVAKVKSIISKETELLNVVTIFEVKYTKWYCSDSVAATLIMMMDDTVGTAFPADGEIMFYGGGTVFGSQGEKFHTLAQIRPTGGMRCRSISSSKDFISGIAGASCEFKNVEASFDDDEYVVKFSASASFHVFPGIFDPQDDKKNFGTQRLVRLDGKKSDIIRRQPAYTCFVKIPALCAFGSDQSSMLRHANDVVMAFDDHGDCIRMGSENHAPRISSKSKVFEDVKVFAKENHADKPGLQKYKIRKPFQVTTLSIDKITSVVRKKTGEELLGSRQLGNRLVENILFGGLSDCFYANNLTSTRSLVEATIKVCGKIGMPNDFVEYAKRAYPVPSEGAFPVSDSLHNVHGHADGLQKCRKVVFLVNNKPVESISAGSRTKTGVFAYKNKDSSYETINGSNVDCLNGTGWDVVRLDRESDDFVVSCCKLTKIDKNGKKIPLVGKYSKDNCLPNRWLHVTVNHVVCPAVINCEDVPTTTTSHKGGVRVPPPDKIEVMRTDYFDHTMPRDVLIRLTLEKKLVLNPKNPVFEAIFKRGCWVEPSSSLGRDINDFYVDLHKGAIRTEIIFKQSGGESAKRPNIPEEYETVLDFIVDKHAKTFMESVGESSRTLLLQEKVAKGAIKE